MTSRSSKTGKTFDKFAVKAMRASALPLISILFILQVQANGVFDAVAPDATPWVQIISAFSVWSLLMALKFFFLDAITSTLSSDLPSESDVFK